MNCYGNITQVITGVGPYGYRLKLDKTVPAWVSAGDRHAMGLSRLNDDSTIRDLFGRKFDDPSVGYGGLLGSQRELTLASWGIEVGFQVAPAGITRAILSTGQSVKFDIGRQIYRRHSTTKKWKIRTGTTYTPVDEEANDQGTAGNDGDTDVNTSNSLPTKHDWLFTIDQPGRSATDNFAVGDRYTYSANFYEFVRVSFDGQRLSGNGVKGGRCGFKYKWRTCIDIVDNPNRPHMGRFWARKNPDSHPQIQFVDQLNNGQTGESNSNQSTLYSNNTILGGAWLKFEEILDAPHAGNGNNGGSGGGGGPQ